jgi:hypothetical protein
MQPYYQPPEQAEIHRQAQLRQTAFGIFDASQQFYGVMPPNNVHCLAAVNQRLAVAQQRKIETEKNQQRYPRHRNDALSPIEVGDALRRENNTFGTCWERACLAASFAAQNLPPETPINLVTVRQPGDHTFLVVGELPHASRSPKQQVVGMNLDGLCQAARDSKYSFVIDPWSDVFCPTHAFSNVLTGSMQARSAAGLRLIDSSDPQNPIPADLTQWAQRVRVTQGLVYHNGQQRYHQQQQQLIAAYSMTPGAGPSHQHTSRRR